MSLGAEFSSQKTDKLIYNQSYCKPKPSVTIASCCPSGNTTITSAVYPSMLLKGRRCPEPTPAEFALYPKVAIPSSIRTKALADGKVCATLPDPIQRFSKYDRYTPAIPCAPLPASANMAGISRASTRECNIYPNI
jgi:hypothetical protein